MLYYVCIHSTVSGYFVCQNLRTSNLNLEQDLQPRFPLELIAGGMGSRIELQLEDLPEILRFPVFSHARLIRDIQNFYDPGTAVSKQ